MPLLTLNLQKYKPELNCFKGIFFMPPESNLFLLIGFPSLLSKF